MTILFWTITTPFILGFVALLWLKLRGQHRSKYVQRTFCRCPGCDQELVSRAADAASAGADDVRFWYDDEELVHYRCPCTVESCWDFGPPCPILLWSVDRDVRTDHV